MLQALLFVNQIYKKNVATVHRVELMPLPSQKRILACILEHSNVCGNTGRYMRPNQRWPRSEGDPQPFISGGVVSKPGQSCYFPGTAISQGGFALLFCSLIAVLLHTVVVYCMSVIVLHHNSPAVTGSSLTPVGTML